MTQVLLNASFLENRIAELGLKQWWLAEQLSVSPRTVLRWVNGQIARVQHDNVVALAGLLGCEPDELILRSEADAFASPEDQTTAARAIEQERLLEVLTPTSSYALAETLIRSTLHPNLPLPVLGKLYNLLAMATARQFAFERSLAYAAKALAIGERIDNRQIVIGAKYAEGWVRLYAGELDACIDLFEACLAGYAHLEDKADEARAWFSLGSAYGFKGEYGRAFAALETAVGLLDDASGAPEHAIDLSMALYVLGAFRLDDGDVPAARAAFARSEAAAAGRAYGSGVGKARAGLALVTALEGDVAEGTRLFDAALDAMRAKEPFIHPLVFRHGARIARLRGDDEGALALLREALPFAARFKAEQAALAAEIEAGYTRRET